MALNKHIAQHNHNEMISRQTLNIHTHMYETNNFGHHFIPLQRCIMGSEDAL